jgi:cobalamin biosynthesis protein CbiG
MTAIPAQSEAGRDSGFAAVVAGIGCTSAAASDEIVDLVVACLLEAGLGRQHLVALTSDRRKEGHVGLSGAARTLGVPLWFVDAVGGIADQTSSPAARERGLAGLAEAAAGLAGRVILPKRKGTQATCALAVIQPSDSFSIAESTLSASTAGP